MGKTKNLNHDTRKHKKRTFKEDSSSGSDSTDISIVSLGSGDKNKKKARKTNEKQDICDSCDLNMDHIEDNKRILHAIQKQVKENRNLIEKLRDDTRKKKEEKPQVDSKDIAEREIIDLIVKKRANEQWRENVREIKFKELSKEKISKLKTIYLNNLTKPRKIAVEIARVLWTRDFIKNYIIGPCKRTNRAKDRCEELPKDEMNILRTCLKVFTSKFLEENEWQWFVRSAINQATRDSRSPWDLETNIDDEATTSQIMDDKEKSEKEKSEKNKKDSAHANMRIRTEKPDKNQRKKKSASPIHSPEHDSRRLDFSNLGLAQDKDKS